MKNLLIIDDEGVLRMASSIDDGSNDFYLNGDLVPSSDWVGSGNYIYTVAGVTYTIKKAASSTGNYQLIQDSEYNFRFQRIFSKKEEYLDLFYPVGSYYDTSDDDFDPNVSFVGTWVKLTDGRVLIATGTGYDSGDTGGSKDAVVVSHSHGPSDSGYRFMHSHGTLSGGDMAGPSGAGRHYAYQGNRTDGAYWGSGESTDSAGVSGTGKNMQPYLVVNRWHRTA